MLLLKSLHIIFIVTWFAGLFYLPRLFVYHSMRQESEFHAQFQIMEKKLFWGICVPSAVMVLLTGIGLLALFPAYMVQGWMRIKLLMVISLLAYQGWCWFLMIALRTEPHYRSHIWFRWFNEFPAVALVVSVVMVVFKP